MHVRISYAHIFLVEVKSSVRRAYRLWRRIVRLVCLRVVDLSRTERAVRIAFAERKVMPQMATSRKRGARARYFDPRSSFNPRAHLALGTIQRRAVFSLFRRLNIEWVPGEYWDILVYTPDPIEALKRFSFLFGLRFGALQRLEAHELEKLETCVGILLELNELRAEVVGKNRAPIVEALQHSEYERAEELLRTARILVGIFRDADALGTRIPFAGYALFLRELHRFRERMFCLSHEHVDQIRDVNRVYLRATEQFEWLLSSMNAHIRTLVAQWPDTPWGHARREERDGMIAAKEACEILAAQAGDLDAVNDVLERLRVIHDDIGALLDALGRDIGGGWKHAGERERGMTREDMREAALACLGFPPGAEPPEAMLKKAYRRLARMHHPDLHMHATTEEQKFHKEKFEEAADAYRVLVGS